MLDDTLIAQRSVLCLSFSAAFIPFVSREGKISCGEKSVSVSHLCTQGKCTFHRVSILFYNIFLKYPLSPAQTWAAASSLRNFDGNANRPTRLHIPRTPAVGRPADRTLLRKTGKKQDTGPTSLHARVRTRMGQMRKLSSRE